MSAKFIVEYAGAPVRFSERTGGLFELVQEHQASRFICEADAWLKANANGLALRHCEVINLYERQLAAASTN